MLWKRVRDWFRKAGPEASSQTPEPPSSTRSAAAQRATASPGPCLQFSPPGAAKTDAILGLDFGTSCSKAVIRLPFVPGGPAFAVPLAAQSTSPYLLRSVLPKVEAAAGGEAMANLKVRLMLAPSDEDARALAAVYLSRVARIARCWFLAVHAKNFGKYDLTWSMNVGVPSSGFGDMELKQAFLASARAAWMLSMHPETPGPEAALNALALFGADEQLPVDVIPEIVASAEGYRRSAFASPGVHVMMDVGASTLDVCAFILKRDSSGDPFGLAVPVVEQLGAAVLHDSRVRALDEYAWPGPAATLDPRDPASTVPDALSDYVASGHSIPLELSAADSRFREDCELTLRRALGGMYRKNPLAKYGAGIPVFLAGGGGRMKFFAGPVENLKENKPGVAWNNALIQRFDSPEDLRPHPLDPEVVARLLVAYGLSHPRPDFGEFVDASSVPDIDQPPRRRIDDWYISKDQV